MPSTFTLDLVAGMCVWLFLNTSTLVVRAKALMISFLQNQMCLQMFMTRMDQDRSRSLRPIYEFFLVMCRLRQGFPEEHLAHFCHVSISTVSRIFITWINFMYLKLGQINIWPSRKAIDDTMPKDSALRE